jgi:DNA repair ATPase RecN
MPTEVHNHFHGPDPRLERIEARLNSLLEQGKAILMAIDAQTQQILDRIDAATTSIGNSIVGVADDIRRLVDRAGLDPDEVAAFEQRLAQLEAHGQSLVSLDAENVPEA